MADFPIETHRFQSFDGVELAWTEMGQGRDAMLIHGYASTAEINWIRYGHAQKLAEKGFRVIMPDLRGHGMSAAPHDAASYPPDVTARDALALVAHLGLTDYDLGGYSLGARTTVRMIVDGGATPRKVMLAGMGLSGLTAASRTGTYFRRVLTNLGSFERGSSEWLTEAFLKTSKADPQALLPVLDTFVDTRDEDLARLIQPTVVIAGVEDDHNGSAHELAERLPNATFVEIPGNHMSAVTRAELGRAIADFFAA